MVRTEVDPKKRIGVSGASSGVSKMLRLLMIATVVSAVFGVAFLAAAQPEDGEFYAYYTRLDYQIPIEQALDYIPQEIDEE